MIAAKATDVGKRREINEDSLFISETPVGILPNLFVVADGMGGHNAGDFASQHVVEQFVEALKSQDTKKESVESAVRRALEAANGYIYEKSLSDKSLEGMGTTFVMASCIDNRMFVSNVGDSRLYLINSKIVQITIDHSQVEEMIAMGVITRKDAKTHPDKNIITRAVGVEPTVEADFFNIRLERGDIILLCSDGLTNMVDDEDIYKIVSESKSLDEAVHKLIDTANNNGGRDNITAVLIEPYGGC